MDLELSKEHAPGIPAKVTEVSPINDSVSDQVELIIDTQALSDWVGSQEGQGVLRQALEDTRETIRLLDDARKIDPGLLHEPMTI